MCWLFSNQMFQVMMPFALLKTYKERLGPNFCWSLGVQLGDNRGWYPGFGFQVGAAEPRLLPQWATQSRIYPKELNKPNAKNLGTIWRWSGVTT